MSLPKPKAGDRAEWRDGFLFVGNQIALDLVNTRLVPKDEPMELIPSFSALLRWFQAAGLMSEHAAGSLERNWGESRHAERTAAAIRQFREELRSEILRWEAGKSIRAATIEELNRLMAEHPMLTRLRGSEGEPELETYFEAQQPADLFAPMAQAAAELFATTPAERVRKCDHCVVHFYDNSKKGNRRWCSMQICGNRQKVAAYAARQREAAQH